MKGLKEEKLPELDERGFMKHAADLKGSLRATHRIVRDSINKCDAAAREEYFQRTGRKALVEHADTKAKEGIIEDLNIQINQLHTGREAGSKRGIHRHGAYDLEKTPDPLAFQSYFTPKNSRSPSTLSKHHIFQIQEALGKLSYQEWTSFVMTRGYCTSLSETAGMLGISVSSVRTHLKRADKKIKAALDDNIFLQGVSWEYESGDSNE